MTRPRILYVCNAYPPHFIGGAELIAEKYAKAHIARGGVAGVFTAESQVVRGDSYELFEDAWNGVPVWRIQSPHEDFQASGDGFVNPRVESQFDAVLDAFEPDIVHAHNLAGLSIQILHLAKRRGLRVGLTLHDHWMFCTRNTRVREDGSLCDPLRRCPCQTQFADHAHGRSRPIELRQGYMRRLADEVDFFHFPSLYLRGMYERWGLPPDRCHWIPYGIELDRFEQLAKTPRHGGPVRFAFLGYLGEHKGITHLVDAFAAMSPGVSATLDIAGSGHLRESLERRVTERGLTDRIRFLGKIQNDDIETVYRNTDCLVLPSQWPENHPVSINEAMACGLAVIATDSGGSPELVRHNHSGLLVPVGDTDAITRALELLATHPDTVDAMGEAGRRDSQRRSLDGAMDALDRLYQPSPASARAADHTSVATSPPERILVALAGNAVEVDATCRAIGRSPLRNRVMLVDLAWLRDLQRLEIDVLWLTEDTPVEEALLWSTPVVLSTGTAPIPRSRRTLRLEDPAEVLSALTDILEARATDHGRRADSSGPTIPRPRPRDDALHWLTSIGAVRMPT